MARIVGIMQPTYLPWIGYLAMVDHSDVFVLLDDVQFAPKTWQQRNRIKGPQGEMLLTVPITTSSRRYQRICDVEIDFAQNWAAKHLKSLQLSYARAPFLNENLPALTELYSHPWKNLRDLNVEILSLLCAATGIDTQLVLSSSLHCREDRNARIIDICRRVDAEILYDTEGAETIIDREALADAGIQVIFQHYQHPVYRQQHGPFLPFMSSIDLILNEGPASLEIIRSGTRKEDTSRCNPTLALNAM